MTPLRIVFFGSPDFAVPTLRALAASAHPVVGVVSQPDRPRGRGQKVTPGAVAQAAADLGLLGPGGVATADLDLAAEIAALSAATAAELELFGDDGAVA